MRPYFEKMQEFGQELKEGQIKSTEANVGKLKDVEALVDEAVQKVKNAGMPAEKINARGQLTVWQRLDYLVDEGTFCPLHTLYNPKDNVEGTTNVIDGLGKISGKWAVIIGFDNKVFAGAWLPGQSENVFRCTDLAKRRAGRMQRWTAERNRSNLWSCIRSAKPTSCGACPASRPRWRSGSSVSSPVRPRHHRPTNPAPERRHPAATSRRSTT